MLMCSSQLLNQYVYLYSRHWTTQNQNPNSRIAAHTYIYIYIYQFSIAKKGSFKNPKRKQITVVLIEATCLSLF
jgi:hypothetical protein